MNLTEKILADVVDDIWDKEVESEIDHLTSEGEKYYPFGWKNLQEALSQADDVEMIVAASFAHVSHKFKEKEKQETHAVAVFGRSLMDCAIKYWRDVAREQAEKNVNMRSR